MKKPVKFILFYGTLVALGLIIVYSFILKITKPGTVTTEKSEEIAKPLDSGLFAEHIFNISEKKQTYISTIKIYKKNNIYYFNSKVIKIGEKDVVTEAKMNMDFETLEWKYFNQKKNINVAAVRKGNKIFLTGTFGNKKNNKKEVCIDERKWQQVYQLGLMSFAVKEPIGKSIEFWSLNPDEPESAMVLAATNESRETINLNGKKIKTARLKIGLAGFLSVFWTGDYWFRLSDGYFVKAKVSGEIFVELKEGKKG